MCLAVPAKVIELGSDGLGSVELSGIRREVSLELLEDVKVGDYVILHVGYALERLDPEEAEKTLELFRQISQGEKS